MGYFPFPLSFLLSSARGGRCSSFAHSTTTTATARSLLFTHTVSSLFGWCLSPPPESCCTTNKASAGDRVVGFFSLFFRRCFFLASLPPQPEPALPPPRQEVSRRSRQHHSSGTRVIRSNVRPLAAPPRSAAFSMAPSQRFRGALAPAERGDIRAQGFVGCCYYHGEEGVTRDLALAFKYFRMAAERGENIAT